MVTRQQPAHPVKRRRKTALELDRVIRRAAVTVIRDGGPDDLNLSAVARAAGATTGAVYARYENRQELLLDAWNGEAAAAVQQLIALGGRMSRGDAQAASIAAAQMQANDPALAAAIALMIVAPRIEELDEALLPQLRSWFDDSDQSRAGLLCVALLLGAAAFDAAADAPKRSWDLPLQWAAQQGLPAPPHAGNPDSRKPQQPQDDDLLELVPVDTGDEIRDELLRSMALIVTKSGFTRATTSRIARAVGYPQSAVFELWPTRADLLTQFTTASLQAMVRTTSPLGAAALAGDAAGANQALARILSPAYRRTRRLRLETVLAAMSDRQVAGAVSASDAAALQVMQTMLGSQPAPGILALAEAVRATVLGLVLLEETVGGCADLDYSGPIGVLLSAVPGR